MILFDSELFNKFPSKIVVYCPQSDFIMVIVIESKYQWLISSREVQSNSSEYWCATSSHQVPYLAGALLHQFSLYYFICADVSKHWWEMVLGENWLHAGIIVIQDKMIHHSWYVNITVILFLLLLKTCLQLWYLNNVCSRILTYR